eukprot:258763-Chlamydomonas_euryale.AAC.1
MACLAQMRCTTAACRCHDGGRADSWVRWCAVTSVRVHACMWRGICMRGPKRLPHVKSRRGGPCTIICRGRRSRPITPAEAKAGPRPGTCMHVNAPSPEVEVHVCA